MSIFRWFPVCGKAFFSWSSSVRENSFPLAGMLLFCLSLFSAALTHSAQNKFPIFFLIHVLNLLFWWAMKGNQDFRVWVSKQALVKGIKEVSSKSIWDAWRDSFLSAPIPSENQDFLKYFISHSHNYWSLIKTVIIFLGRIFRSLFCIYWVCVLSWVGVGRYRK